MKSENYECAVCGQKTLNADNVLCWYCKWYEDLYAEDNEDAPSSINLKMTLRKARLLFKEGKNRRGEPLGNFLELQKIYESDDEEDK